MHSTHTLYLQVQHSLTLWEAMGGKAGVLEYEYEGEMMRVVLPRYTVLTLMLFHLYEVVPQTSVQFKKYIELAAETGANAFDIKYMNMHGLKVR
jgi:hypothetical protein